MVLTRIGDFYFDTAQVYYRGGDRQALITRHFGNATVPMPDFTTIIGYLSGIYLIHPKLEASSLLPTLIAVHIFDGILCLIIARHSRRKAAPWGLVGLTVGVWAVLPLLLLRAKKRGQ